MHSVALREPNRDGEICDIERARERKRERMENIYELSGLSVVDFFKRIV